MGAVCGEVPERDAEPLGLVGEIVLDACAGEDDDADRQHIEHLVVALERCGLGAASPIGLSMDPKLRAHKDPSGYACAGRSGLYERIK